MSTFVMIQNKLKKCEPDVDIRNAIFEPDVEIRNDLFLKKKMCYGSPLPLFQITDSKQHLIYKFKHALYR